MNAYRKSRGIGPIILNVGSGWKMVSPVLQPLCSWGRVLLSIVYEAKWATAGHYVMEKINLSSLPGIEPWTFQPIVWTSIKKL
jgi:hypothetical protein